MSKKPNKTSFSARHIDRLKAQGIKDPEKARQRMSVAKPKATMDYQEARTRKMVADAEISELNAAERKGQLVESARVLKQRDEDLALIRAMLDSAFVSELPAKQGGSPADQIAAMNRERLEEIYAVLSKQ